MTVTGIDVKHAECLQTQTKSAPAFIVDDDAPSTSLKERAPPHFQK
jgi:hypothetical protein